MFIGHDVPDSVLDERMRNIAINSAAVVIYTVGTVNISYPKSLFLVVELQCLSEVTLLQSKWEILNWSLSFHQTLVQGDQYMVTYTIFFFLLNPNFYFRRHTILLYLCLWSSLDFIISVVTDKIKIYCRQYPNVLLWCVVIKQISNLHLELIAG